MRYICNKSSICWIQSTYQVFRPLCTVFIVACFLSKLSTSGLGGCRVARVGRPATDRGKVTFSHVSHATFPRSDNYYVPVHVCVCVCVHMCGWILACFDVICVNRSCIVLTNKSSTDLVLRYLSI